MKHSRRLFLLTLLSTVTIWTSAQNNTITNMSTKTHRVIMQVTQGDSLTQLSVIGQIRNIRKSLPNIQIEVVCHASALDMLVEKKSKVLHHLSELSSDGVVFAACENTMKRKNVKREELASGVTTVPSALVQIILRQEEGWSYVKGGY